MNDQFRSAKASLSHLADQGWYKTSSRQSIDLCPTLPDAAIRLYRILKALVIQDGRDPVRAVTVDEICQMLPKTGTKTGGSASSPSRIRDLLTSLSDHGLLSTPDGKPLKFSWRSDLKDVRISIQINDLLYPDGYKGPRNVYERLTEIRGEDRRYPEDGSSVGPVQNSVPEDVSDRDTGLVGQNSVPLGQNSAPDPHVELGFSDLPRNSSSSSTSSAVAPPSPAPVRSAAPPGMMEEEQAIPSGDEGAQEQESPQDDLTPRELTVTPEDQRMALRLLGAVPWPAKASVGLKAKRVLVERLSVLAAGGWTEEIVREYITARVPDWKKVARPTNLVVHLLDDAPERVGEAFMESSVDEPQVLVSARRTLAGLERQLAVQKSHIKGCATCDDAGMVWSGGARWEGDAVWHKHGSMTLSNECRKAGFEVARIAESLDTDHAKGWEFTPQEVPADA